MSKEKKKIKGAVEFTPVGEIDGTPLLALSRPDGGVVLAAKGYGMVALDKMVKTDDGRIISATALAREQKEARKEKK